MVLPRRTRYNCRAASPPRLERVLDALRKAYRKRGHIAAKNDIRAACAEGDREYRDLGPADDLYRFLVGLGIVLHDDRAGHFHYDAKRAAVVLAACRAGRDPEPFDESDRQAAQARIEVLKADLAKEPPPEPDPIPDFVAALPVSHATPPTFVPEPEPDLAAVEADAVDLEDEDEIPAPQAPKKDSKQDLNPGRKPGWKKPQSPSKGLTFTTHGLRTVDDRKLAVLETTLNASIEAQLKQLEMVVAEQARRRKESEVA